MRNDSHKFILENQEHKTNQLINSSSPYLRQHAFNPVDWVEWSEAAFEKAKSENKLVIVSIGYSACHWCHVMAHECFEDDNTAALMNERFVCIKVDREELPDVDQTYMDACQLINGNGGWPLNAFTLPDKRPIHALTYMPRQQWQKLLITLSDLWKNTPETAIEYAAKLENGLKGMSLAPGMHAGKNKDSTHAVLLETFEKRYDQVYGGFGKAPKFPMPNNLNFLLNYHQYTLDDKALKMLMHTLDSMALGGIYDPLGGGFARYSVDERWFAPHFEKMLYDNAQLIEIYAASYAVTGNEFHKQIALQTMDFCEKELKNEEGLYCSALDADSEGIEGLYYTFTYNELEEVLGPDTVFFSQYFQCRKDGNWEHGRNILYALDTREKGAAQFEIDPGTFNSKIDECLAKLHQYRNGRIRPGLDDKCICTWNNLYLKAMAEASLYFNNKELALKAEKFATRLTQKFEAESELKRIYARGKAGISAYLEDYASLIDALHSVYKTTRKEDYLLQAKALSEKAIIKFYDSEKGFFRFNSGAAVLHHKYDTSDDVINSGNSMMAFNLHNLSWYFDRQDWRSMSENMLNALMPLIRENAPWYSKWATLRLRQEFGFEQLVIAGDETSRDAGLTGEYARKTDVLLAFTSGASALPLLQHKSYKDHTLLYICKDMTCSSPVETELIPKQ